MPIEKEIKTKYKELHDLLSESYYNFHNISKEAFDAQHGQIWADMETELIVEGYLTTPEPPRDLLAEIDELRNENADIRARLDNRGLR